MAPLKSLNKALCVPFPENIPNAKSMLKTSWALLHSYLNLHRWTLNGRWFSGEKWKSITSVCGSENGGRRLNIVFIILIHTPASSPLMCEHMHTLWTLYGEPDVELVWLLPLGTQLCISVDLEGVQACEWGAFHTSVASACVLVVSQSFRSTVSIGKVWGVGGKSFWLFCYCIDNNIKQDTLKL